MKREIKRFFSKTVVTFLHSTISHAVLGSLASECMAMTRICVCLHTCSYVRCICIYTYMYMFMRVGSMATSTLNSLHWKRSNIDTAVV